MTHTPTPFEASDEASERIEGAHFADLAFLVRNIVGKGMSAEDIHSLARALANLERNSQTLTKAAVVEQLLAFGRSRDKAEQLTNSILR